MRLAVSTLTLCLVVASVFPAPIPEDHRDVYVYHGRRASNLVALTCDDGPHHEHTGALMAVLRDLDCPATFFVVGDACRRNPQTTREMVSSEFEIGNHSMTHTNLRHADDERMREEVDGLQTLLGDLGRAPRLFRPPYGSSNRALVEHTFGTRGLEIICWSLDTEDWRRETTPAQMIDTILAETRGGEIILMHDSHAKAVEVTRAVVPALRERGLEFVTVSAMLEDLRAHPASEEPVSEPSLTVPAPVTPEDS